MDASDAADAAIAYLLRASTVDREGLPSLDVCFNIAAASPGRIRALALQQGPSEALPKLVTLSVVTVNQTSAWLRSDAALALDASISTSGYEHDLFKGTVSALPLAADSKGKAERLDADVLLHRSKLLFRCLLAALSLLRTLLAELTLHGNSTSTLESEFFVSAVLSANATARQLFGTGKSGFLGLLARRVAATCTALLSVYCAPTAAAASSSSSDHKLVPYVIARAVESPPLFQASMELLAELVQSSREACAQVLSEARSAMLMEVGSSISNTSSDPSVVESFRLEVADSDEGVIAPNRGVTITPATPNTTAGFQAFWEDQLHSRAIVAAGSVPVPFSLKYEGAEELTGAHAYVVPCVTDSEKRGPLPWGVSVDDSSSSLLGSHTAAGRQTCDPSRGFVSAFLHRNMGIPEAVAAANMSASIEVHEAVRALCVQLMVVTPKCAETMGATLLDRLKRLAFVNASLSAPLVAAGLKEKEGRKKVLGDPDAAAAATLQENSDELCRLLLLLDSLCCTQPSPLPCLALVRGGMLHSLLVCLRSCRQEVVALALQCIASVYRRFAHLAATAPASHNSTGNSNDDSNVTLFTNVLSNLADALVEVLPGVVRRFQETEQTLVLSQTAILVQLFRLKHTRQFLEGVARGLTIEFFVIKLWLSLEDSFQALVEITEALKSRASSSAAASSKGDDGGEGGGSGSSEASVDDGEERLQAAFAAVAVAAVALRCAAELVLLGYTRGWFSLSVLTRSMRMSMADPRKVSMQFQRAYTMWWTNDRLQVERARMKSHFVATDSSSKGNKKRQTDRASSSANSGGNSEEGGNGGGEYEAGQQQHVLPPLLLPRGACFAFEEGTGVAAGPIEARNAMINTSLRRVVETAARAMEYNSGKSSNRVDHMPCADAFAAPRSVLAHDSLFLSPFSLGDGDSAVSLEFVLAATASAGAGATHTSPLSALDGLCGDDAIHAAVRRVVVAGWERRSSIFDTAVRYVRLTAGPRSVDPAGAARRRERRNKRKLDEVQEKKQMLAAAAQEKADVEARRRTMEEQREALLGQRDAASAAAAAPFGTDSRPVVALSGVPRANVHNVSVVPIFDYGKQD
jgi:hypothetical protein